MQKKDEKRGVNLIISVNFIEQRKGKERGL